MTKKKKTILITAIIIICMIMIPLAAFVKLSHNKNGNPGGLNLTDGWTITDSVNGTYFLVYENTDIASVIESKEFVYGSSSHTIVSNWIGMHAAVAEESVIAETNNGGKIYKVLVHIEPSAAQEIAGVGMTEELHYFYLTSDNDFFDVLLLDEQYMTGLEELLKNSLQKE